MFVGLNAHYASSVAQPRAVHVYMTMQDAYQVTITLQLQAPNGNPNFYSTMHNTHWTRV